MSALTPHIRALRALGHKLREQGFTGGIGEDSRQTLVRMGDAHLDAADQLEAEDRDLRPPLDDKPITYDPKGKR